jgi:hypothetical protein
VLLARPWRALSVVQTLRRRRRIRIRSAMLDSSGRPR